MNNFFLFYKNEIKIFFYTLICSLLVYFIIGNINYNGDAKFYIDLFNKRLTQSPFAYRLVSPFIANLLPFKIEYNFLIITFICNSIIAILLYKILNYEIFRYFILFFLTSYIFFYYNSHPIRVDPLMLLLITMIIYLLKKEYNITFITLIFIISITTHEMSFIFLIFLLIDNFFKLDFFYTKKYKFSSIILTLFFSLVYYYYLRKKVLILSTNELSYNSDKIALIKYVINYSGGFLKHLLRIYSSFGPVLLYAMTYIICYKKINTIFALILIFIIQIIFTFLAADTLRVMELSYFLILFFASNFLNIINSKKVITFLILIQISYSIIVFGNLNNSFEKNIYLNIIAISLSLFSFIICIIHIVVNFNNKNKNEYYIS